MWQQVEDLGKDAGFSEVCWNDANNGCASATFSAADWVKHFNERHPDTKEALVKRLVATFAEYSRSQPKGKK